MTRVRLGGFVITFRREVILRNTLSRLLYQSRPPDRLLVIDNASSPSTEEVVRRLEDSRLRYHPMHENTGPAGAAAFAVEWLLDEGHDWIYWGDDDDPPRTSDTLDRLLNLAQRERAEDLGGVAALGARWDWRVGELQRFSDEEIQSVLDVDAVGGNQSLLLRSKVFRSAGLPNAELFFGLEEIELCLRVRRAGYRLLIDGELMKEHRRQSDRLGVSVRRSPGRQYPMQSLWRRYYNTRNYIHLMRRTFDRPDLARRETLKAFLRSLAAWQYGFRYGSTFNALQFRAVRDGYRDRMGLTVTPQGYGG